MQVTCKMHKVLLYKWILHLGNMFLRAFHLSADVEQTWTLILVYAESYHSDLKNIVFKLWPCDQFKCFGHFNRQIKGWEIFFRSTLMFYLPVLTRISSMLIPDKIYLRILKITQRNITLICLAGKIHRHLTLWIVPPFSTIRRTFRDFSGIKG